MQGYKLLTVDDFTKIANTANVWSEIASFYIPRERVYALLDNVNIELFLYTKDTFSGDGTTTDFTLNNDIVDNERLPDDKGAAIGFVGGSEAAISSINYSTNTVTFASAPASGTDNVDIYYIFREGDLEIRVEAPVGTKGIYRVIFNSDVRRIHTIDQFDTRKALRLYEPILLPEDFKISIRIKSSVIVNWDSANYLPKITIPYIDYDLNNYVAQSKKVRSKDELFDIILEKFIR
jgi:hypothetical protein